MNPKFPECIYLGEFHSSTYGDLPAYLPATQGGFCLHYKTGEEVFANHQIENTVLCLLEELPAQLVQVHIFDFANRPNFLHLTQLKQHNICHFYLNEHASTQAFNELETTIQTRYHILFNGNDSHLDHYNARSPRPEPYHILIINTDYFPNNSLSAKRLSDFISSAYNAGIYVIALHNCDKAVQSYENSLQTLLDILPKVQILDNFSRLSVDEATLPVQKMAQFDFRFSPADINQTKIIQTLSAQFTKQDSDIQDFLHIKIGTQPNGSDAYLSLGQASMNYGAMLLGVPGSGKSTLMNNIIMQIGKHYHAGQIRLYLLDFAGVEFNQFKHHPNVEKIFLEANAQTVGLSLLESLRTDVEKRRQLFLSQNIKDITTYNQQHPQNPLPYIVIMIDEFHRLFKGNFTHQEKANDVLEEIVREWRKFGFSLFLSTQTLKDVSLRGSVKDQIGLRMTYRVNSDMALGFDIFASHNTKTILGLQQYQILMQTGDSTITALVDKPTDIDAVLSEIYLSRPLHLQVQAQVIQSSEPTVQTAQTPPKTETATPIEPITETNKVENPNDKHFAQLDNAIAKVQQKLARLNADDDDAPAWLNQNATQDDDTPNWLQGE